MFSMPVDGFSFLGCLMGPLDSDARPQYMTVVALHTREECASGISIFECGATPKASSFFLSQQQCCFFT